MERGRRVESFTAPLAPYNTSCIGWMSTTNGKKEEEMKVRDLISRLMEMDPDAMVMFYSDLDEGASFASGEFIVTRTGEDVGERWYVKGDYPDVGLKTRLPLVIIR